MPTADAFPPDSEYFDEPSTPPFREPPAGPVETHIKSKKTKKKKRDKKDVPARDTLLDDESHSSTPPETITPSVPTEHGVKLPATTFPALLETERATTTTLQDSMHNDLTAMQGVDVSPPPEESTQPISPKPEWSRPIETTKPSRPKNMQNIPQPTSTGNYTAQPQQRYSRSASSTSERPSYFGDPPPPHMPQAHFFQIPDLGWGLNNKQDGGRPAGADGYCCTFDSLADAGDVISAKKAQDALLVGSEGGLDVFRVLASKLEVVGRLEGLRGSVVGAKILPQDEQDELRLLRPLVAVVIHGLMSHSDDSKGTQEYFQTTVDVYSLQTQRHIATLYTSTPSVAPGPLFRQTSSSVQLETDLRVDACGHFITISSGKSGEVFVFAQAVGSRVDDTRFRCVGKFWTSSQTSLVRPKSASAADAVADGKEEPREPLVSLSSRWLAVVPPLLTQSTSIQGQPLLSDVNRTPPGITTHAPPPQPPINCEVVGEEVEGAWSRLGRQAVKYSQKGFEMGLQGWKELTQPSSASARPPHDRSSSRDELFPPTNAASDDSARLKREPAIVSIIDLQSLLFWEEHRPKHFPPPMATFALVDGCNFVSFSSTGTRLLTSSRTGVTSTIWDLKQVAHGISQCFSTKFEDTSTGPCIRQLRRITRNSPSTILACSWSRDDDSIAMLTAHGTVHLHEVPKSLPSPRHMQVDSTNASGIATEKAGATVSLSSGMSPPSANQGFLGSIKSGWESVSTQVQSIRSTNSTSTFPFPTTFAGFREATAAAGTASSRAVAKGLSRGYTAAKGGASDYWHADDNKIRHTKALTEPFAAKSLKWIRRSDSLAIAIACGGSVHIHPVQFVTRRKGDALIRGLKHEKYAHKAFALPQITVKTQNRTGTVKLDACVDQGPHGFWSLRATSETTATASKDATYRSKAPQAQVDDVETNPPYCPFHIDRRVNLFAFDEDHHDSQSGLIQNSGKFLIKGYGMSSEQPWAFGEPLPPCTKINERGYDSLDATKFANDEGDSGDEGDYMNSQIESTFTIQPARRTPDEGEIYINTRRKPGSEAHREDEFDLLEMDGDGTD